MQSQEQDRIQQGQDTGKDKNKTRYRTRQDWTKQSL